MKTVYFIRHAKSSWADMSLRDFDRPLNKRGKRDAPFMAEKMNSFGIKPDLIISSPANRAYTTAKYFAAAMDIKASEIVQEENIYEAYPSAVFKIIQRLPSVINTIFIFGHNPAFTMIANSFEGAYLDNVPTCGIVEISAEINQWKDFVAENGVLKEFHYPKQYFK